MRLRKPSPAMLVALLSLFVALGGSSYAALQIPRGSVGTKQLKNGAVTSPKVKNNSLLVRDFRRSQRAQLQGPPGARGAQGPVGPQGPQGPVGPITGPAGGALAGSYPNPTLAPDVRGPAVAGASVDALGQLLSWFNRRGGPPTIEVNSPGVLTITFPGSSFGAFNSIAVATLFEAPGFVTAIGNTPGVQVRTFDTAGMPADDSGVTLVVYDGTSASP
jgi:hypothetical protein